MVDKKRVDRKRVERKGVERKGFEERGVEREQRRYFRINDYVGLNYRLIEGKDAHQADEVLLPLDQLLRGIDRELNNVVNTLWREQPVAAKAIGLLNRKISLLAAEVIQGDIDAPELSGNITQVNISACGIAFAVEAQLPLEQPLALEITLKPANTLLSLQGKVVSCEPVSGHGNQGKPYRIRVEFQEVGAEVEEQLIQHIVQRQSAQLSRS